MDIKLFPKLQSSEEQKEEVNEVQNLLVDYFNDTKHFDFTEEELATFERGAEVFCTHATSSTLALSVRSLLKQYAAYNATNVLVSTKMLTEYPHRRILETMQFVIDVMDPNLFSPEGYGMRSIQKLRLVHAMIRARIKNGIGIEMTWDEKEWGKPINQQDMIFAIHTFSVEVLDGLISSGAKLTQEQIEDYYLTWHYIGRALGVDNAINPKTYAEGKAMQELIYKEQFKDNNPNGPALSKPLMTFMKDLIPVATDEELHALIRVYNDESDYPIFTDILDLDVNQYSERFYEVFTHGMAIVNGDLEKVEKTIEKREGEEKLHDFMEKIGSDNMYLINKVVDLSKTWKGSHFRISDGFGDKMGQRDQKKTAVRKSLIELILGIFSWIKDLFKK